LEVVRLSSKSIDVIVSGHLCLDLIPQMEHVPLSALAVPGKLHEVGKANLSTGGAVSNTGLALHRLGANVRLMASVGDDVIGRAILDFLEQRDPSLSQHISVKSGQPTSYTIVLSPEKVDRIFLHCTGTNSTFNSTDVNYDLLNSAKIFHLGYPPILPRLYADDGEEFERLMQLAKATGVVTSLDTTLPDPQSDSGRANWCAILKRALPYTDIFIPSIEEILFMLRRADYDRWHGVVLEHLTHQYLDELAHELLDMGPAIVGFKLGELGVFIRAASVGRLDPLRSVIVDPVQWADITVFHPAFQVEVVGTIGAGDSAYAGFLLALLRGLSAIESARWACAVGACTVEAADATSGVRSWEATSARLESGWATIDRRLK
jgi:sugar/nucleoside kinase (ribokinase family)